MQTTPTYSSAITDVLEAETAVLAQRKYDESYFPLAIERMRTEAEPCSLLILTVGSQPYSVALSLARSPAARICAIHTPETRKSLDQAIQLAAVDASRVSPVSVDKSSAIDVYRAIRDAVESGQVSMHDVVINITSGTKAMTAAASSAAGTFGIRQLYIESTFMRDGLFGKEKCHVVEHPLQVLGDPTRQRAETAFDEGRFESAQEHFQALDDARAPDYHFGARVLLCRAYSAMDRLRFNEAAELVTACVEALERVIKANVGREPLAERACIRRLHNQSTAMRRLHDAVSGKAVVHDAGMTNILMRWLLSMARRRRSETELRALLGYRALELALQRRLATFGIDTGSPDYGERPTLLEDYNAIAASDKRDTLTQLPLKIGLDAGLTLLWALKDERIPKLPIPRAKIRHVSTARNRSLFAHGFKSISDAELVDFDKVVAAATQAVADADGFTLSDSDDELDYVKLGAS